MYVPPGDLSPDMQHRSSVFRRSGSFKVTILSCIQSITCWRLLHSRADRFVEAMCLEDWVRCILCLSFIVAFRPIYLPLVPIVLSFDL